MRSRFQITVSENTVVICPMRSLFTLALLSLAACSSSTPAADAVATDAVTTDAVAADAVAADAAAADLKPDQRADSAPCKLVKPYSSKNAVCNGCAEAKCCAEINGCLGDTRCDEDYVNCILACTLLPEPDAGVSGCLQQCATAHPQGKAAYDVAIGCAEAKCASECA